VRATRIITSAIEHPAVAQVVAWLTASRGTQVVTLPTDEHGVVSVVDVERALCDGGGGAAARTLVTIMHSNNETGTLQPIAEIARVAHAHGALVHTDCAQSTGKVNVDVRATGADLVSIAGHKFYAPKGVGALYVRRGVALEKMMLGADHERDRRAGTENVLGIAGLGTAAEVALRDLGRNAAHMAKMRDRLQTAILGGLPAGSVRVNGHPEHRLPNTCSVSFKGVKANVLLAEVANQVSASAGAACHSGGDGIDDTVSVSATLRAMRVPLEYAMGTVRLSVGRDTTPEEVDTAASVIISAVLRMTGNN
jgi:cysteine desulfurase